MRYTKTLIETQYKPKADAMIEKIQMIASTLWHSACVKVYGSYATCLCIPSSDLDLVVMGATAAFAGQPLRLMANELRYGVVHE